MPCPLKTVLLSLLITPAAFATDTFTIAVLPDTQHYVDSAANIQHFHNQTQWIVDQRATENIVFVTHAGDIVQNGGSSATQWARADAAIDTLDNGAPDLAYSLALGNHDYDVVAAINGTANTYLTNFGPSRYAGKSWFGGQSPDQRSQYQVFSAGGRDFLHLSLEWRAVSADNSNQAEVATWVQGVLDAHPDSPTIITTHEYLRPSGGRNSVGNDVFNSLIKDNSQVFMAVSGHLIGEAHQTSQNSAGQDVFELLADYQGRNEGGQGWMQLIEFDEENSFINVTTYSPSLDQFETDANSQFSFAVDFDDRFGAINTPEPTAMLTGCLGVLWLLFWFPTCRRRSPF